MDRLSLYIESQLRTTVPKSVSAMAGALHLQHSGITAIIAYGSALRDSAPEDTLIDYYVIVESASHLSDGIILRKLGELIPPNVCYYEMRHDTGPLRCKYALITMAAFERLMTARNPYLWARFAQPTRLVWKRDDAALIKIIAAIATAMRTAYGHGRFLSAENPWVSLFLNTYRTELRPETANRAEEIVAAEAAHYAAITPLLNNVAPFASSWAAKRVIGKLWSLARLAKNAFTFSGGADYAAWKIERHSGVKIVVTEWQRRHPFLAGLMILPKLIFRKGLR